MNARDFVFLGVLIDRCPSLLPLLQEHIDTYDQVLPHVFLGELTRWIEDRYQADPDDLQLTTALGYIDEYFAAAGPKDGELIAASFLENLPHAGEPGAEIRDALGPSLREHLDRFG